MTVTGQTLGENLAGSEPPWSQDVVRPVSDPLHRGGGLRVLRGNIAPNGALIKQSAASAPLLTHEGRAVVFTSLRDLTERVDDPGLDVEPDDILVLQNAGPKGAPGMPESGYLPIPKKLLAQGVKDMVRISDARMSGTAFGTIVLHVSPEAAVAGRSAWSAPATGSASTGRGGASTCLWGDAELVRRRAEWTPPPPLPGADRGYHRLYLEQVTQAEEGCDFAFLGRKSPPSSILRAK